MASLGSRLVALWLCLCLGACADVAPSKGRPARPSAPSRSADIVMVGDIMMGDRMLPFLEAEGVGYPFASLAPALRSADLTVGNLEGPVAVEAKLNRDLRFPYKVPPWTLQGLREAGFDLLSLANNHLVDCGQDGVRETMRHVEVSGMQHFGAGHGAAARKPKVVDVSGTRVAFVGWLGADSLLRDEGHAAREGAFEDAQRWARRRLGTSGGRLGLVVGSADEVEEMVAEARAVADVVVVYAHWGIRYRRAPSPLQRLLAHTAIDAGADLVVGHHAHIWQPLELYRGKLIAYGLGNFAFGSRNRRARAGLILRAHLRHRQLGRVELTFIRTANADPSVAYQARPLAGPELYGALHELRGTAAGLEFRVEEGRAVIDLGGRLGVPE